MIDLLFLHKYRWRRRLPAIFWAVFAMGLSLQVLVPHLKIEHHAFVIPPALFLPGKTVSPSEIVERERILQSLSAILTIGGAVGLGRCYWKDLFGQWSFK